MTISSVRRGSQRAVPQPANPSPVLKQGSRGTAVRELQQLLNSQGAGLDVDGVFGPKVQAALLDFQRANGLTADAVAGPQVWAKLRGGSPQVVGPVDSFDPGSGNTASTATVTVSDPQPQPKVSDVQTVTVQQLLAQQNAAQRNVAPLDVVARRDVVQPDAAQQTTIAEVSNARVTTPAVDPEAEQRLAIARRMVRAGGSGTDADAEAVARSLQSMPIGMLQAAEKSGVKVVACRGGITDAATDLKGVQPRGWPPGSTWDIVPGAYLPDRSELVIATVEDPNGGRMVPPTGMGHGSFNIAAHELAHGLDDKSALAGHNSGEAEFVAAYSADTESLRAHDETYLLQEGAAGRSEAFAETFARYISNDPTLQGELPGMYSYWQRVQAQSNG